MSITGNIVGRRRTASALLVVTGLVAILAVMTAVFILRTREDAQAAQPLLREAQARIMLDAACLYLLETSRMGWGAPAHGWVDNRNGSLGPRPARLATGIIPQPGWWNPSAGAYPFDDSEPIPPASIPADPSAVPWDEYGYRQVDPAGANEALRTRFWPHPGGVCRSATARWVQPPYACTAHYTLSPIKLTHNFLANTGSNLSNASIHGYGGADAEMRIIMDNALTQGPMFLDPQPVAERRGDVSSPVSGDDFISGKRSTSGVAISSPLSPQPLYAPKSTGRSWFRIYRELPSEHDGQNVQVGSTIESTFDTVAISSPKNLSAGTYLRTNDSIFMITCGAGATQGFRSWAEVIAEGAEQLFSDDPSLFHQLRSQERILWFRVCWSGFQGGSYLSNQDVTDQSSTSPSQLNQTPADPNWNLSRAGMNKHAFGTIAWMQRIASEPPRW